MAYGVYYGSTSNTLLVYGTSREIKYWAKLNKIKMGWLRVVKDVKDLRGYPVGTVIHFIGDWVSIPGASDVVKFAEWSGLEMRSDKIERDTSSLKKAAQVFTTPSTKNVLSPRPPSIWLDEYNSIVLSQLDKPIGAFKDKQNG